MECSVATASCLEPGFSAPGEPYGGQGGLRLGNEGGVRVFGRGVENRGPWRVEAWRDEAWREDE